MAAKSRGPSALGQFLRARREQVSPGQAGIPDHGRRRVPGLRREELALLAGVSVDYYVRLEQGRDHHPSAEVLTALARALRLDEAAAAHLHQLARPAPPRRRRSRPQEQVRPAIRELLDLWAVTPAIVLGRHADVLAANPLGPALWGGFRPGQNLLRAIFLDPAAPHTLPAWDQIATDAVASLRANAGADLDDPRLTSLVGELSLKSGEFRRRWASHHVRRAAGGIKHFHHPLVGDIALSYESLVLPDPGQALVVYHATPDSPGSQALSLLAGLIQTGHEQAAPSAPPDRASEQGASKPDPPHLPRRRST
jgi:transcriptional regulator with XRE-family HTH domain